MTTTEEWNDKPTGGQDEIAALQARVAELEADLAGLHTANHRQALCIQFTGSALGGEYVGTIDGLPKAAGHVRKRAEAAEALLSEAVKALMNIERIYYMEATKPDPTTVRRMAARMNGVANDVLTSLTIESETIARIVAQLKEGRG